LAELTRGGNVLGALALVLADRTTHAAAGDQSQTAAAALCALGQSLDGCTVDRLRRVLGMTSSGTVRLIDRLEASGQVRRGPGGDARSTSLTLTAAGRRAARRVAAARGAALEDALAVLSPAERDTLERLAAQVLDGIVRAKLAEPEPTPWICRLCDLGACRHAAGECPAANAARDVLALAGQR
jgi:DNA-binding MarR family transcriptional regulator